MKILITGAAGFLGSWFLDHFIRVGFHDVWSVDIVQHPTGLPMDEMDMVEWLADFEEDVDIAFHFAAPVGGRMKIEHDPMYNADAFRLDSAFFRWAVRHAKLAVYPSSSAIYPISLQTEQANQLLFEGLIDPRHPSWSKPDELYGFSKLAGELMAWKAWEKHGLPTLAIRPFSGYGPHQTLDYPVPSILSRAIRREDPLIVWGGLQTRDFVYVTDIVGATMARIEAGVERFETMNIASGIGVTFHQIAENAAQIVGYSPEIRHEEGMPTGVARRRGSPDKMSRYYRLDTPLLEGLRYTVDYLANPPAPPEPVMATDVKVSDADPVSA